MRLVSYFLCFIALSLSSYGQSFVLQGSVKDKATGETLIGASVYIESLQKGEVTDIDGHFYFQLSPATYQLKVSYVGYAPIVKKIKLSKDQEIHFLLTLSNETIGGVSITSKRLGENVRKAEMSVTRLDAKAIEEIPALFGEVDVIKTLQLLPGIQSSSEGSTGFSVRGGSPDQNLVLLDDTPVYNVSHMMGFFSVFNNDVLRDIDIYKGDIPAAYGGRLSSLLQINSKEADMEEFSAKGGIGTIASRLTIEAPIIKNKMSLLIAGRRTYADLFLAFSPDQDLRDTKLYFYDLNGKFSWAINENNKLLISGYMGDDVFGSDFYASKLGNRTLTAQYIHFFNKKMFSTTTLYFSKYKYNMTIPEGESYSLDWDSDISDLFGKVDFTWYPNENNTITFGITTGKHTILPAEMKGVGEASLVDDFLIPKNNAWESAIYVGNQQEFGARLTLRYGLRFSMLQNVGPATVFHYDDEYQVVDSSNYSSGKLYTTYPNIEPRFSINYMLSESASLKGSYTRTVQYLQLAQNSTAGNPIDVWFLSSPTIKPQLADQIALGFAKNFKQHTWETSIEVYYKDMQNAIDFKDHAELMLNPYLEGEVRTGKAWSYGAEFLVKKVTGNLTGWISYTYSRSFKKIAEINEGEPYNAPFDKPNDFAIVLKQRLSPRLLLAANWIYATGAPTTLPTGKAYYGGTIVRVYNDRNSYRIRDYHRLDLSLILQSPQRLKNWNWNVVFSIYNAYNRHNTWSLQFVQDEDNPDITHTEHIYLFGIIPSVTFNFNF